MASLLYCGSQHICGIFRRRDQRTESHDGGKAQQNMKDDRIVVPRSQIRGIIAQHHDSVLSGHWGYQKTYSVLKRKFVWSGITKDVREFVRTCNKCQLAKSERKKMHGLLEPLTLPERKWQSISMDWVVLPNETLTRDAKEYNCILVITDRATKMKHLIPCNIHDTAEDTAHHFLDRVVRYHGLPRSIHTDRDTRIVSEMWNQLCALLDIKMRHTSAFHPQVNGQEERSSQL